jgi:hypothetical protein
MIQANAAVGCVLALSNAESTLAISTATLAKFASVVNLQSQGRSGMDLNYLAWTVPALFLGWRGHTGQSALPTASYRYEVIAVPTKLLRFGRWCPKESSRPWRAVGPGVRWRRTRLATVARPPVLGWTPQRPSRRTSARPGRITHWTRTFRGREASAQEKPSLASVPVTGYATVPALEALDESKLDIIPAIL